MLRMIIARFEPLRAEEWTNAALRFGSLPVETFASGFDGTALHVFLTCQCKLTSPPISNANGELIPTDDVRRHLEEQLELAVDAVSVATRTRRSIRSPDPCLAFIPDVGDERAWLDLHSGIARRHSSRLAGRPKIPFSIIEQLCVDRSDGLALLAEARANPHASGQFHEFFRVFERAFKLDCEKLAGPLGTYLSGTQQGYTLPEIENWLRIRGPLTHADRRKSFLLERDAFPVIHRMEQAAVDVVVNKKDWRDPSTTRAPRWRAAFGSCDSGSGIYVTQAQGARIQFEPLDQFGIYPFDLNACLKKLPPDWWLKRTAHGIDTGTRDGPNTEGRA